MISNISDNNDWRYGFLIWKTIILLFSAVAVLSSVWLIDVNSVAYAAEQEKGIQLNFKDTPVETILGYLSEAAGLVVVSENRLTDRITVISKQSLSLDEAVSLINTILQEKGFTAIRTGKTLKIATISDAKKMSIPVRTGNDPNEITPSDDIVTYIIPVSYANASTLQENLISLLSESADFSANADTNTLIITDTANNIRRILEIVRAIDTHKASIAEIRVFHLSYADAEDTADLINDLFDEQEQTTSGTSSIRRMMQMISSSRSDSREAGRSGMPGGGSDSSSSGSSSTSVSVVAKADERTNSIVVSASQDTMNVIENVVEELDSDSSVGQALFVYTLKNAKADNLVDVLNNLFSEVSDSSSQTIGGPQVQQAGGPGARTSGGVQSSAASTSSTGLVGEVYIEADEDTNSLIIMTSPANYEKVKSVLDELDKPVPQVLIKVLIAEVTHDGALDLGAEFSFLNDWHENDIQVESDFGLTSVTDGVTTLLNEGGLAMVVGEKFDAKLSALAKKGKLNILSKPYILASNNQTATITVGNEVPFITDSRTTETGQTINTIDYEDIGIILEVTPVINDEGLVIMDVSQEISAISDTTVKISDTVDASVFSKRSSENRVIARSGQTVVIGGLMEDRETGSVKKIPLLGDIPLLGVLFRSSGKDTSKTELLIFLTPTVAATDNELLAISQEKMEESKLIRETYGLEELENQRISMPVENIPAGD